MTTEANGTGRSSGGTGADGSRNVIVLVVAAVVVAVVVAFGVGGFGSSGGSNDDTVDGSGDGVGPGEAQPVTVIGEALEPRPESGGDPELGAVGPTLEGSSFDGTPVTIEPGKDGKPIMIAFLAHWCSHCNYQLPQLTEWIDSGRVPDDLVIYAVATSLNKDGDNYPPSGWFADNEWPYQVLADSTDFDAGRAYGLDGLPFMVVLDGDGKVAVRFSGETSADDVDKTVRAALR